MMPSVDTLDYALKIFQLIGIPVGIFLYYSNSKKERLEQEVRHLRCARSALRRLPEALYAAPRSRRRGQQASRRRLDPRPTAPGAGDVFDSDCHSRAGLPHVQRQVRRVASGAVGRMGEVHLRLVQPANFAAALPALNTQFDQNFCTYLDKVIASTRTAQRAAAPARS